MSKIGALRDLLVALLQEHERDGALPTSARFLFYELVQRGQLSKTSTGARRPDQNLHDALTDIRESGHVPWDWIVDETRSLDDYTGYPTIKQGTLSGLPYIVLDPWRGRAPLVLTESRSLAGVLRLLTRDYACRIAATNGQCGGFLRTDIGPRLQAADRVLYLGDLDLAGGQIEANTRGRSVALGAVGADRAAGCSLQPADHREAGSPLQRRASARGGGNRSAQPDCSGRHPAPPSQCAAARTTIARS